jgi:hypothetical protein
VQYSIIPRTIASANIAQNYRLARLLSVASSVVKTGFCNRCDAAPTPTGFAEIVSDYSQCFTCRILPILVFALQ